ncbi:MAG: hypothetical protein LUF92_12060 [Clostridiales bacterium]|nr:hypothetical protein [Clostridiales bacterium]
MANIQHEDAILKLGTEYFRCDMLKQLGITYTYKDPGPTELISLTVEKMYQDFTFLTEGGFYIHIEFQSGSDGKLDLRRFHAYEATMSHNTGKKVYTYVIYTTMKRTGYTLDCGLYTYKVEPVYTTHFDNRKVFQSVGRKIAGGMELDDEDIVRLALTPIMGKGLGKKEAILKAISLLKGCRREAAERAVAILYAFADKFLDTDDLNEVKGAIYMTRLGQLFQEDVEKSYERGVECGVEFGVERGENRLNTFYAYLIKEHRESDLVRCVSDKEYRESLQKELNM